MAESETLSTEPVAETRPKPGDGEGPNRLRESLADPNKKKGNRNPKCGNCGGRHNGPCKDGTEQRSPAPASSLFTPANTGRLLKVPFTVAAIRSHCGIWLLTPEEEAELVASAVPFLNEWVAVDPKWAALFMFSWSLGGIAVGKAMGYSAWQTAMKAEADEAAKARRAPPEQPLPQDRPGGLEPTKTPPMPSA